MLADEVNGDVGLLQATLHDRDQLAGDQRQRLFGDDVVPQFDQLAPQLVALRFEVRGRGGQKDGLRMRGFSHRRASGVAQVLEHLGDIVGDVIHPLVEALSAVSPNASSNSRNRPDCGSRSKNS